MIIGRLKQLRDARHMSQQKLADVLQVAQATVASWEVGRTEPSHAALKNIADYFNVTTDYLLGREVGTPSLSRQQTKLLDMFNGLNVDGQNTLMNVLGSLRLSHAKGEHEKETTVVQKNSGGTNFLVTGGNNNYGVVS